MPKDLGEIIGTISVVRIDESVDMVEVGYCIGKKWWNNGYMSEALATVIEYMMRVVKINRLQADHDINNPNSGKVMLKCGLKREGVLRHAARSNQGVCDMVMYSILASDYFGNDI